MFVDLGFLSYFFLFAILFILVRKWISEKWQFMISHLKDWKNTYWVDKVSTIILLIFFCLLLGFLFFICFGVIESC